MENANLQLYQNFYFLIGTWAITININYIYNSVIINNDFFFPDEGKASKGKKGKDGKVGKNGKAGKDGKGDAAKGILLI